MGWSALLPKRKFERWEGEEGEGPCVLYRRAFIAAVHARVARRHLVGLGIDIVT
jgi:hypothetical protein